MLPAVQSVGQLFSVPHSRKRKKYLESLEAGMDLSPTPGGQQVTFIPFKLSLLLCQPQAKKLDTSASGISLPEQNS